MPQKYKVLKGSSDIAPPQTETGSGPIPGAGSGWVAHNTQHVRGWAVATPHPSGDGSFYAPILEGLTEREARLIAGSAGLLKMAKASLALHPRWSDLSSLIAEIECQNTTTQP